ncbi:MAG: hypothetical protein JWO06_2861, partial [Bacteroidota bacterium]|nr:hypothetical protein [Bacteroidota bacterium]
MNFKYSVFIMLGCLLFLGGCKPKTTTKAPNLVFKFVFDSTQARLNNFGQPASMPSGHAGQNPSMNSLSAHYIELAPSGLTALGQGLVLYSTPSSYAGGDTAIDFAQEPLTANNGTVFSVPIKNVTPGTYQYLRVSLAYQNFDVQLYVDTTVNVSGNNITVQQSLPCTVASFVGFDTYISSYKVKTQSITVNASKKQGYWGFESIGSIAYGPYSYPYNYLTSGQAPVGATTVVNPLFATSPIPAGSCVATGQFNTNGSLKITGNETQD